MTKTLTALIAAVTSAIATAAVPTTADARCPGCVGEPPPYAPPGYVYYSSYHESLPAPCNWYRVPVYDAYGNMVGWRGRPQAFCSWVGGFRPTLEGARFLGHSATDPACQVNALKSGLSAGDGRHSSTNENYTPHTHTVPS